MASASASLSFSRLLANNPKPINSRKSFQSKPNSSPPLVSSAGEATTYTRLPPKHDFQLDPSLSLYHTIKLREAPIPSQLSRSKNPSPDLIKLEQEFLESDYSDDAAIGSELDEADAKEKGVPAVMRCFDRAKIYVKSGDGGDGVVAFRREKYVPYGGPSGGDGGRGGDVYVEVDGSMNSLLPFRKNVHFRAGRGGHGLGRKQAGAKGENVVVKVAPGTVVRDSEGMLLMELLNDGQRALILSGGRGGRGNASFKSGFRKAPRIAENGEAGAEM